MVVVVVVVVVEEEEEEEQDKEEDERRMSELADHYPAPLQALRTRFKKVSKSWCKTACMRANTRPP